MGKHYMNYEVWESYDRNLAEPIDEVYARSAKEAIRMVADLYYEGDKRYLFVPH